MHTGGPVLGQLGAQLRRVAAPLHAGLRHAALADQHLGAAAATGELAQRPARSLVALVGAHAQTAGAGIALGSGRPSAAIATSCSCQAATAFEASTSNSNRS